MSEHEQTRQAVAKALHAVDVRLREESGDFGVATAPWDEAGDSTRGVFGEYADAALAAMRASAPGPVPVTEAERLELGRICYENFTTLPGTIGTPASWEETAKWPSERQPWMDAAVAVRDHVLAARTTASAPEPNEAEIEAAIRKFEAAVLGVQVSGNFTRRNEAKRELLSVIAARNAGQGE